MTRLAEPIVAFLLAGVLTWFDLDRTFYVPARAQQMRRLYTWWWAFIVGNGLLACGLDLGVRDLEVFKSWTPWLRGLAIGAAYLAVIRVKFTTFEIGGKPVPFGFELIYEGAKGFVYKRINRIAKAARYDETIDLAQRLSLKELETRARLSIQHDALLTDDEKQANYDWLQRVVSEAKPPDDLNQRTDLAGFILSGQAGGYPR